MAVKGIKPEEKELETVPTSESSLKIHLNRVGRNTKIELNGKQVGFVQRVEASVDVCGTVVEAKLYFAMPEVTIEAIDKQIEVFKVAGISVKEFADVVKERDKYKQELEELKKLQK